MLLVTFIASGCAQKPKVYDTAITTRPPGATVSIDGTKVQKVTPFSHIFDFSKNQEYSLLLQKDGYFQQEVVLNKAFVTKEDGQVEIRLEPSPLWQATTFAPATNNWVQILVGSELTPKVAWQLMVDAVIKRSFSIKEINYEAGYLQTQYTIKKFDSKNGEFFLRCQMIITLVSVEPLIYRVKDVSEWSGNGVSWHPYNRIFTEHANMIEEIQGRLRSY
jgi:hypothetical protein